MAEHENPPTPPVNVPPLGENLDSKPATENDLAVVLDGLNLQKTIRTVTVTAGITISIGMICWAAVRITEQPPWLVLALAILGPFGLLHLGWIAYLKFLSNRLSDLNKQLDNEIDKIK